MSGDGKKRFLVIGAGSIGRRHLRNLKALGAGTLAIFDPDPGRAVAAAVETGAEIEDSLDRGLDANPDAVLVCTPNHLHVPLALQAAERGSHIFVEKPISNSLEGIDELVETVRSKNLIGLVGFNLRFHPGLQKVKKLLENGSIGRLLSCRFNAGQYLPDWHPWEDFRKGYSANRSMGGGILLDTHEFDYLAWLAGRPKELTCFTGHVSDLEIDTEDVAEINFWLEGGAIANLHVDYLQRAYQRRYEFYGQDGTLLWDWTGGARLYEAERKTWIDFDDGKEIDSNLTYLEEMKHLLCCLRGETQPVADLQRGKEVLEWVCAAKKSAAQGSRVVLPAACTVNS